MREVQTETRFVCEKIVDATSSRKNPLRTTVAEVCFLLTTTMAVWSNLRQAKVVKTIPQLFLSSFKDEALTSVG